MATNGDAEESWIDALAAAAAESGGGPGPTLFRESRVDETVEAAGAEPPTGSRSAWSGLAAERAERLVFLAGATPADVAPLVRCLGGRRPRMPPRPVTAPPVIAGDEAGDAGREAVIRAAEAGRGLPPRFDVRVRFTSSSQSVVVARGGAVAVDRRAGSGLRVEVRLHAGRGVASGLAECASPDAEDPARLVHEAAARAERRLGALPAPSGEREIVLGRGSAGVVLHELIGHAREGDIVAARATWLTETVTLSEALTVMDDPRRARIPWAVDDEGTPPAIVPLVRDGRVTGALLDRASAAALDGSSNGHARRASYRDRPMPRMGCTFAAAGRATRDDLVAGVTDGILVRRLEAGGTDVRRGVAWFRVADADRIVRGRVTHALTPFILRVDGPRALIGAHVGVADDVEFDVSLGHCMRRGQPMVTSVGAPTIWIGLGGNAS